MKTVFNHKFRALYYCFMAAILLIIAIAVNDWVVSSYATAVILLSYFGLYKDYPAKNKREPYLPEVSPESEIRVAYDEIKERIRQNKYPGGKKKKGIWVRMRGNTKKDGGHPGQGNSESSTQGGGKSESQNPNPI